MLRTVTATRYVTPLREGGSLPGLVEADDDGLYVVKFRGAGQGPRALVAEWVAGEIGRALGLPSRTSSRIEVAGALGDAEPDQELQDLVHASDGLNLGLDFLPGALPFNPAARPDVDPEIAATIVWLDGLVTNPDRTVANPNLLVWHDQLWCIDHGAALYVHHTWRDPGRPRPPAVRAHRRPRPAAVRRIGRGPDAALAARLPMATVSDIVEAIPDLWLPDDGLAGDAAAQRAGVSALSRGAPRVAPPFVQEAERARRAA